MLAILVFLLGATVLQSQTATQPDCRFSLTFTSAGRSSAFAALSTPTATACTSWRITYQARNMSAVSLSLDGTADTNGVPGVSWITLGAACPGTNVCSITQGGNPLTDANEGTLQVQGYFPWVSINVGTYTSSGSPNVINVQVNGWRIPMPNALNSNLPIIPPCTPATGYLHCRQLSISAVQAGTVDSTNFPNYFSVTDPTFATVANGGHVQNTTTSTSCSKRGAAVPADFIFTTDRQGTTLIKGWEWETYNSITGASAFHFNAGTVSHTANTLLYISYDNAGVATCQTTAANTWDANFQVVNHVPDGTTLDVEDSSSNNIAAATHGGPTAIAGQLDGGVNFIGSSSQSYSLGGATAIYNGATGITVSIWAATSISGTAMIPYGWNAGAGSDTILLEFNRGAANPTANTIFAQIRDATGAGLTGFTTNPTSPVLSDGNFHMISAVWDLTAKTIVIYYDGVAQTMTTVDSTIGATMPTLSGTQYVGALNDNNVIDTFCTCALDEIRLSNTIRAASWITLQYNQQKPSANAITMSAEF